MQLFNYTQETSSEGAIATLGENSEAKFIAGGNNATRLDEAICRNSQQLVDINSLPLSKVEVTSDGVRIGALARMSDVAATDVIRDRFPVISEALLASASAQLRNMASIGGNLLQRTRCGYFRDTAFPCNKRELNSGCPAIAGEHESHAILGVSDDCIATHASDLAVALIALDAVILVRGALGERQIPTSEFYHEPGKTPNKETALEPGELIVGVEVPNSGVAEKSHYLKVRDRTSYAFALVSAAVGLEVENNQIRAARVALGGVGTKPWRSPEAEKVLENQLITEGLFRKAAEAALADAKPLKGNAFKVRLAKRTLVRALETLTTKLD